jgi:predicted metal-binding membrane protein
MWSVMMVAMMLPSLMPTLTRYRHALIRNEARHLHRRTLAAAAAYFLVWSIAGAIIFPLGIVLAQAQMQHEWLASAVPVLTGAVVMLCGAFQFTRTKRRCLTCCREAPLCISRMGNSSPWLDGMILAARCAACCANLMIVLLVIGVMDLVAMAVITVAITVERIAPFRHAAQIIGGIAIVQGWLLILEAIVA